MQLCFGRFSIAHFYEVWLPTTFAKYFRFDSRLSLWLQLVLDSLIWNALNGKILFFDHQPSFGSIPKQQGTSPAKGAKPTQIVTATEVFSRDAAKGTYLLDGWTDEELRPYDWFLSCLLSVVFCGWLMRVEWLYWRRRQAAAAIVALAAVHDMAKKMNENLRIIYSIFTDFFWVIRSSQRNSFLMDFGTKWEFLCAVCRWNECHLHSFLHHSH